MTKFGKITLAAAFAVLTAPAAFAATIIDDFTTFQRVEDVPSGFPVTSNIVAPEAIGGWRRMTVTTDGTEITGSVLQASGGELSFSNASGETGTAEIVYDANGAGLNADLTAGGNTGFFFAVSAFDIVGAADFALTVSDGVTTGTYTETLDNSFDPFLPFSVADFAGINFGNVQSLTFTLTSTTPSFDGALTSISVIPLPASALLLLGGLGGLAGVSASKRRRRKAS